MHNIKQLSNLLPIQYDNKVLNLISFNDIDWYVNNCREYYYEQYLDFKFSKEISIDKSKEALYNIIVSYKLKTETNVEARLLLKDINTNEIYGGCTIFERNNNSDLEIAYFVLPKYHNKNICTDMLKHIIYALQSSDINFNKILLTIREDNIASLKVGNKLRFRKLADVKGKYKTNRILYLEKRDIDIETL